jgi:hypothetical protein
MCIDHGSTASIIGHEKAKEKNPLAMLQTGGVKRPRLNVRPEAAEYSARF